jgi:hypothetical protein
MTTLPFELVELVRDGRQTDPALFLVAESLVWPLDEQRMQRIRSSADHITDWHDVLARARRHRVVGQVAHALNTARVDLPSDVKSTFSAAAGDIAFRELAYAQEAKRVSDLLRAGSVDVTVLKGVAVAMLGFGRLGLRQNADLDILVTKQDFDPALQILLDLQYVPLEPNALAGRQKGWIPLSKDIALRNSKSGLLIELHHQLFDNNRLLLADAVNKRTDVTLFGDATIQSLSGPENLVYLCAHASQHMWSRLKWLADISAVEQALTLEQKQEALAFANHVGLSRLFAASQLLACMYLGVDVPPTLTETWRADGRLRRLVKMAARSLLECGALELEEIKFGTTRKSLSHYLLKDNIQYWTRELLFDLSGPPDQKVPGPTWLRPVVRPLDWAWRRARARGAWVKSAQ